MKVKNIFLIFITGFLALSSCDLDRFPESTLSDALYWQNQNDFIYAANYLYSSFLPPATNEHYFLYEDQMSDNVMYNNPNSISNGTYLPTSDFGRWNNNYRLIRAANKIIEEARVSEVPANVTARYVAEAKFFRAYAYHELVRRYGDVPLILKTLDTNDEELYAPRIHREVVVDTIYQDLDYAIEHLPLHSELNMTSQYGRLTKGAALAFKSRVALREGTWNRYHNTTGTTHNPDYHLQIAKQAALTVIESNEYELFDEYGTDSYKYLFKLEEGSGPHNKEAIFVYIYGFNFDNNVNSNNYSLQVGQGFLGPTRSLVDSYLSIDGLPIDKSQLYQGQTSASSEFIDRDARLDGILVKPGESYVYANNIYPEFIPTMLSNTGYLVEKYVDVDGGYINHMVIRYAEVLLNYAEATFELDNAISDADINISINLLRDRAGVAHLSNDFVVSNGLEMREEIRRERRVELALEGFRYDDLLRWKKAEIELPKALEGVRYFAAEYIGAALPNLTADSIVIAEDASMRSFDTSKHYLWPLPISQLSLNEQLVQNPNW